MRPGARSPEELETLFEDAFLTRDRDALAQLFAEEAVLVSGRGEEARGGDEIVRFATAMWDRDYTYLADPRRVLQSLDTALIVAARGTSVVRRGSDATWRYAISLLELDNTTERKNR